MHYPLDQGVEHAVDDYSEYDDLVCYPTMLPSISCFETSNADSPTNSRARKILIQKRQFNAQVSGSLAYQIDSK